MIRIVLYSDQPILAQGLRSVLSGARVFELQTVCNAMGALMEIMTTQQPDIILMDLTTEVTFGALSEMKRAMSNTKIVLWVHSISTELAFQAMGLGVRGILRKTLPTDLLVKCLEKVQEGELWFEKALTDSFLSAKRIALTQREGQLVSLLSQGLKNKEIATALLISEGTVKVYLSRLFQKLGVKDRFELALYGLKNLTTGQGALDRSQSDHPPRAGAVPLPGLRSIVLERGPERVVPTAAPFQNVRRMPSIRQDTN
jgi:two-component system, NarL family, nitrate/nitrite response regulator NarL